MELQVCSIEWSYTYNHWVVRTVCGRSFTITGTTYTTDLQVARKMHALRRMDIYSKNRSRLCFDNPEVCQHQSVIRSYLNAVQFFCRAIRIA